MWVPKVQTVSFSIWAPPYLDPCTDRRKSKVVELEPQKNYVNRWSFCCKTNIHQHQNSFVFIKSLTENFKSCLIAWILHLSDHTYILKLRMYGFCKKNSSQLLLQILKAWKVWPVETITWMQVQMIIKCAAATMLFSFASVVRLEDFPRCTTPSHQASTRAE